VLNETTTASVGESGMIIHIIKRYVSYARFKFLVNLEPLNPDFIGKPMNGYIIFLSSFLLMKQIHNEKSMHIYGNSVLDNR
jgi:hypothetical protein